MRAVTEEIERRKKERVSGSHEERDKIRQLQIAFDDATPQYCERIEVRDIVGKDYGSLVGTLD